MIVPSPDEIRLSVPNAYIQLIASAPPSRETAGVDPETHQPATGAVQAHPEAGVRHGTAQDGFRAIS
jgi:hypothetical protein